MCLLARHIYSMEYMEECATLPVGGVQKILCCQCGVLIEPNSANMCVGCLRSQVDITEGIQKQSALYFCKFCERYLQPPSTWLTCALESRELLSMCLKKLKGLNKVHLVDAGFVWTEPHSKRIKVKLTVQKEVFQSTLLQQVFVVEYIVHYNMCEECQRREAQDFWRAVVQLRQKTEHKKTFLYLEQLILKHKAHHNSLRVQEVTEGLDFFYGLKQDARKMVDFLMTVVPCRYKTSQELISHDTHSNTYNYKSTFSVEIVPVCKGNVLCLPLKLARSLGNINQIVLCTKVTTSMHVLDPRTLQVAEFSATEYWRYPFNPLCDHRQLTEFYVLQIEPLDPTAVNGSCTNLSQKLVLADAWVVPLSELGQGDKQLHCRTHLGHILRAGDTAMGFDFTRANVNDPNLEQMKTIPDVLLVKKSYGDKKKCHKQRNWYLQSLNKEQSTAMDEVAYEKDYYDFLEDLEEDRQLRQHVNIYKNPHPVAMEMDPDVAPDKPTISVEEMLEGLTLDDDHGVVGVTAQVVDEPSVAP